MIDCRQLLADYAQKLSEPAFRELVTRYLDLVYSSALRLVDGDAHRAKDVAQIVFADLARKAGELSPNVMLGGWLHRHTCFVAANTMRRERRRLAHEREAAEMNSLQEDAGADFTRLAPLLDDTINQLDDADRTAILLRFYEKKDFRTVGRMLESSEDAARMRVNRALDKLRGLLAQRGIRTTAGALGIVIATNAVQAAPVGFAVTISTAVLAGTAATTSTVITATTKTIAMTTLQKALVTATVAVLAGAGIYEMAHNSRLRDQVQTLQQLQAPLDEQVRQLQSERETAAQRVAGLNEELANARKNHAELLRLRGEVGSLRKQAQDAKRALLMATESLKSTDTPTAAIERQKWMQLGKHSVARQLSMELRDFADKNQGFLPTNWLQVIESDSEFSATETNAFEFVHLQPIQLSDLGTNISHTAIVREHMAWQAYDGNWRKVYGFADGHSQVVEVPDGNFSDWEARNTYRPGAISK